jgi:hypothetical protein
MNIDDLLFALIAAGVALTGIQFRVEYLCRHPQQVRNLKPRWKLLHAARPAEIGSPRRAFAQGALAVRVETAQRRLFLESPTLRL